MSTPRFHALKVKDIKSETADCVSVSFEVSDSEKSNFHFEPGQYLTLRTTINGEEIRRSYSICTSPSDNDLRVAIKKVEQGKFSTFANENLKVGTIIDVMPPMGKFTPKKINDAKHYVLIAAGSGITPIMSIAKFVLEANEGNSVTLIYGNKNRNTIIFREAIEGLKNAYMTRFSVYHILSRETMDTDLFNGRIDAKKIVDFSESLVKLNTVDEFFICGPEEMLLAVKAQLLQMNIEEEKIHIELFTSSEQNKAAHENWSKEHQNDSSEMSQVSVCLDGITFEMELSYKGDNILDAALKHGADLPYACKGGVCSTCRAKVIEGEVDMEVNYALEKDEVAKGYILTCQAHPKTEKVVVDFDAR